MESIADNEVDYWAIFVGLAFLPVLMILSFVIPPDIFFQGWVAWITWPGLFLGVLAWFFVVYDVSNFYTLSQTLGFIVVSFIPVIGPFFCLWYWAKKLKRKNT